MGEPILEARTYFQMIYLGSIPKKALTTDHINSLEDAIESDASLGALGNFVLGGIHEDRDDVPRAMGRYLQCLMSEVDGSDSEYHASALQRLEALAPQHPILGNFILGQVYAALGDTGTAAVHYRECITRRAETDSDRATQKTAVKHLHDL